MQLNSGPLDGESMRWQLAMALVGLLLCCHSYPRPSDISAPAPHRGGPFMAWVEIDENGKEHQIPISFEYPESATDSAECRALFEEADVLYEAAMRCSSDSECQLWPCSCAAIGTGVAFERYRSVTDRLRVECTIHLGRAMCVGTKPRCQGGYCSAL